MCMPRIFGTKLIDGKKENKKKQKKYSEKRKKTIHQSRVDFEESVSFSH